MQYLSVRNVQAALPTAINLLRTSGIKRPSRNGDVLQMPCPVITTYFKPMERVLFYGERDANPFFHFYEALWMLGGRDDVAPLKKYVKRMETFSDDGKRFNAAYGYRWRHHHGIDQLTTIVRGLRENPDDRRMVLQFWDCDYDLGVNSKDVACNTMATFQVNPRSATLDMTVFCRSNDIIWGCYGANAVHLSMLLEYVATAAGFEVGTYTQISVNWHGYTNILDKLKLESMPNPYISDNVGTYPLMQTPQEVWDHELERFLTDDGSLPRDVRRDMFEEPFFQDVAWPIVAAHDAFKTGRLAVAMRAIDECLAEDWRRACREWIGRRTACTKR